MKKGLLLFLSILLLSGQAFAYELILPKEKKAEVTSNYIFFVGKANNTESISINNLRIYTSPSGAFAHSVKLKDGENRIVVRSNFNTQIYRFYKKTLPGLVEEELCEFEPKPAIAKRDRTPMRQTAENSGNNIIAGLYKDTTLLINGSKGDFYRVFLSSDKNAWVAKQDVDIEYNKKLEPASFINTDSQKFKNASIQTITFSKNLPYTVEERENEIIFKVYNPELSDSSVYTLNIQTPKKYTTHVDLNNGKYTFKVSELPKTIQDCTIIIDAGHGGNEKGAIGCLGNEEKDINLKIALELQAILKQMGANVIMTRECDGYVSLKNRVDIGRATHANIFVSIHLNSIGDIPMNIHKNRGTSVYYYNLSSKNLAQCLEKSITKTIRTRRDGVHKRGFAVIRPTEYIGVLVEAAYMTNPLDTTLYTSQHFAYNTAKGIADGILEYINK